MVPGVLGLKPAPNDGTPGSLCHLLDPCGDAVDNESKSDGNVFRTDTCRYPTDPRECSNCTCPYCKVSCVHDSLLFFWSLHKRSNHLLTIERFHSRGHRPYWFSETKDNVCIKIQFNSRRIGLVHQYGRRFFVLEHQYGRRDVI